MRDDGNRSTGPRRAGEEGSWTSKYAGAGLQFGAAIALFALAGVWLDGKFHTSPLFTIIGVFVGGVGGFVSLYTRVMADVKREEAATRADKKGDKK